MWGKADSSYRTRAGEGGGDVIKFVNTAHPVANFGRIQTVAVASSADTHARTTHGPTVVIPRSSCPRTRRPDRAVNAVKIQHCIHTYIYLYIFCLKNIKKLPVVCSFENFSVCARTIRPK